MRPVAPASSAIRGVEFTRRSLTILVRRGADSGSEAFHPGDVLVHPAVQELARVGVGNVASLVEEPVLDLDVCLGLPEHGHVEIREDGAQVRLRHGGADRAYRSADHSRRLAGPGVLTIGTRGVI